MDTASFHAEKGATIIQKVKTFLNQPRFVRNFSLLTTLFCTEVLVASVLYGINAALPHEAGYYETIHTGGGRVVHFVIAFSALFAAFAFLRYRTELKSILTVPCPIRWRLLALHLAALILFLFASVGVYGGRLTGNAAKLAAIGWLCAAFLAAVSAALAFLPWNVWSGIAHATRMLWLYAAAAALFICSAASWMQSLWQQASWLTFQLVRLFLVPFVANIVVKPERMRIGTQGFTVKIEDACSGLEGIGLLLAFACLWLVLFRKQARFPQALLLLPLSIVALFLLNSARIAALILIGNAGARDIAMGGFHSQAGWIAFNFVAFGSAILARRWSWVAVQPQTGSSGIEQAHSNPSLAYLAPFLAILAASIISRAASGSFEWLYSLRFIAALAVLWLFRRSYSQLRWSWGALAPAAGALVFFAWIAADRMIHGSMSMPAALAAASTPVRAIWIGMRILGAVLTVPIAEELAFRGFLMRRFVSDDFDSVPFQSVGWMGILGSSFLFGLMHGRQWLIASLTGIVYALFVRKTGRIGDAVAAHAFTNALLAAMVLIFGQWQLW